MDHVLSNGFPPLHLKSLMLVKPGWKQTQTTTVYKIIPSLQTGSFFFSSEAISFLWSHF